MSYVLGLLLRELPFASFVALLHRRLLLAGHWSILVHQESRPSSASEVHLPRVTLVAMCALGTVHGLNGRIV